VVDSKKFGDCPSVTGDPSGRTAAVKRGPGRAGPSDADPGPVDRVSRSVARPETEQQQQQRDIREVDLAIAIDVFTADRAVMKGRRGPEIDFHIRWTDRAGRRLGR